MRRLPGQLGMVLVLLGFVGCSGGPRMHKVTGTVTFDESPVATGDILFTPVDGGLGPDPGSIKNGKFECLVKEGKHKVSISASKIRPGGALGAGGEPVPEEYIPEEYNAKTTLGAEVTPAGPNHFDFKLHGAKKK